jgi:ribosome-associated toxin RatA of RatAB toxin-antitoxin module
MTTKVEKTVVVNVPLSTVYNQWTQFEEFPEFMGGVEKVTQLGDDRLEWVVEMGGVRRQWIAKVLEQVPDRKVAWAAVEGATNAGAVTFAEVGPTQTEVHLTMEFEPEGFLETVADMLHIIGTQAEDDLDNFKRFIESEGYESGAWRGSINQGATVRTPGVEDAASSFGDSGKIGDPAEDEASFGGAGGGQDDLIDTTPVGEPFVPGERGPDVIDGGSGFGDSGFGVEPGAVRRNGQAG